MGAAPSWFWSPPRVIPCCRGGVGLCVSQKHNVIVVSGGDVGPCLRLYSLDDGSYVREIGTRGNGKGQFDFWLGGLCLSPDGDSVLVADEFNNRVQEVRIVVGHEDTTRWIRFIGENVLSRPEFVDCNKKVIVVSDTMNRISVFSWRKGDLLSRFGSTGVGPGQFSGIFNVRLTGDGLRVLVCDALNHRLYTFRLKDKFVEALCVKNQNPIDVLEAEGGGFIVGTSRNLMKLSYFGECEHVFSTDSVARLAVVPGGGMAVRYADTIVLYRSVELRAQWVAACVLAARHRALKM